ncbi:Hypothetical_protein [Hexamita inflata]|uniref:Hypothetical_protein n=1 Tax=Hexamita inflata TaxID=28002 RepID=A0AA86Q647_9EUKA|nr:Hypothetical protein HINF_LOCUS39583 [Hexamita inflata]
MCSLMPYLRYKLSLGRAETFFALLPIWIYFKRLILQSRKTRKYLNPPEYGFIYKLELYNCPRRSYQDISTYSSHFKVDGASRLDHALLRRRELQRRGQLRGASCDILRRNKCLSPVQNGKLVCYCCGRPQMSARCCLVTHIYERRIISITHFLAASEAFSRQYHNSEFIANQYLADRNCEGPGCRQTQQPD